MEGMRLLAVEEDLARDLFHRLSVVQRVRALISTEAPADISTRWDQKVTLDDPSEFRLRI